MVNKSVHETLVMYFAYCLLYIVLVFVSSVIVTIVRTNLLAVSTVGVSGIV